MHSKMIIRFVRATDEARWRELWTGYCAFYEIALAENITDYTWSRIIDPDSPVSAIVVCDTNENIQGFANFILHDNTWNSTPVCYLEDLFVDHVGRGKGYARGLLDWLVARMHELGWSRLYWMTRNNNATARRLYDHYSNADDFVRYVVKP